MSSPTAVLLMARELAIGGTERQLTVIAKSLDRSLFTPHVGCFRDGFRGDELRAAGVPVLRLPVTSFRSASAWQGATMLRRYLAEQRIHLVHTFDTPLNVWAVPVARFCRVPVVLSSQRAHRELSGRFRWPLRVSDRLSHAIVVNCLSVQRQLIAEEGVPPSKIHLCYNGIETGIFHPRGRVHRDSPVIGIVCALRPEKNVDLLLNACRLLPGRPRIRIVGSGPEHNRLQALAAGLDCVFEPTTTRVAEALREIDIFVLPSRSEALSNALMEAMACGCAVAASDVGGNPELVAHEQTGMLFRAGDVEMLAAHLRALIEQPQLRARLASAGAAFIAGRFTIEHSARTMAQIYLDRLNCTK